MYQCYDEQCSTKLQRLQEALGRYGMQPARKLEGVVRAEPITSYRRRAKLVVAREGGPARAEARPGSDDGSPAHPSGVGRASVGLYQRQDNQRVVDISDCLVLSPVLRELVCEVRGLASAPPAECACLLEPAHDGGGVLMGLDVRELCPPAGASEPHHGVLMTLVLAAERVRPVEELRRGAAALCQRLPLVTGLAVSLKPSTRQQTSAEFVVLCGAGDAKDALGSGYQLVSHTSFLHVHRSQADRLYGLLCELVGRSLAGRPGRVLDLYGGTGAIALSLAQAGHAVTLVESYPPAAGLALRAAQAQRLSVEVVTGDVASITKVLAGAGATFDVTVANPPRRGLSPAAREALAALGSPTIVYVACDLDNLSRDVDHLTRLGFGLEELRPLDMLPLTEEIEVVAVLRRGAPPQPVVLYADQEVVALDKPPHEPCAPQPEYPVSLLGRMTAEPRVREWLPVVEVEASTSGVCLLARDRASAERWLGAMRATGRLVYLAAARGVTPAKGAITRDLRGIDGAEPARTRYRRLAIGGGHSVLRVVPEHDHPHQIRRHLAAIGHPLLGDARYGHAPTNRYFEEKHGLDRSFLHLVRLEVLHPRTGERLIIESPLPADLRSALTRASDDSVIRFLENKRALGGSPRQRIAGAPLSERAPLSGVDDYEPESTFPGSVEPPSQRVIEVDMDEAPRTVRGELLSPDEDE
jgi:23S rRNA (uracil1939-C5)-methyltransferase